MGRGLRQLLAVALAVGGLLVACGASASPRDDAVKLADQANAAMEQGEFGQAAGLLEQAVKLYYSPVLGLSWARAKAKQGRLVEARDIVTTVESTPLPDNAKPSWTTAKEEAVIFGVELDGRIPTVLVAVEGSEGAKVTLDGASIEVGRATRANPGKHDVLVTSEGGETRREELTLKEKEARTVTVRFEAESGAADASLLGPVVAFSVAGVALVVGTVTGIIFLGKASDLKDACPADVCPPERRELLTETSTLGNISTAAFVMTALAAATGVVLVLMPFGEDEDLAVSVEASPAGASLRVRF